MLRFMLKTEKDVTKQPRKSTAQTPCSFSSDSENENEDQIKTDFQQVIDEYSKITQPEQMPKFQKKIVKDMRTYNIDSTSLNMLEYGKLYQNMASEYQQKFTSGNVGSFAQNRARYFFSLCSEKVMRIGNSSSVIERAFSDALRSIDGRRGGKLRKDLIL